MEAVAATVMEQAMDKATGRRSAPKRLHELATSVLVDAGEDFDEAMRLLEAGLNDDPMLWPEIVGTFRAQVLGSYLRKVKLEIEGLTQVRQHTRSKPGAGAGAGHCPDDSHITPVPTGVISEKGKAAVASAKSTLPRWLATFMVNGMPLGGCTKGQAIAWAGKNETEARFLRALVAPLPTDDAVIGDYLRDEDADKAMRAARTG